MTITMLVYKRTTKSGQQTRKGKTNVRLKTHYTQAFLYRTRTRV